MNNLRPYEVDETDYPALSKAQREAYLYPHDFIDDDEPAVDYSSASDEYEIFYDVESDEIRPFIHSKAKKIASKTDLPLHIIISKLAGSMRQGYIDYRTA